MAKVSNPTLRDSMVKISNTRLYYGHICTPYDHNMATYGHIMVVICHIQLRYGPYCSNTIAAILYCNCNCNCNCNSNCNCNCNCNIGIQSDIIAIWDYGKLWFLIWQNIEMYRKVLNIKGTMGIQPNWSINKLIIM